LIAALYRDAVAEVTVNHVLSTLIQTVDRERDGARHGDPDNQRDDLHDQEGNRSDGQQDWKENLEIVRFARDEDVVDGREPRGDAQQRLIGVRRIIVERNGRH
jgi:hypothetical protein